MMKRASSLSIVSLVVVFFALGLFPYDSALCRAQDYALLLQKTPSYGGNVSPEIGIHHYASNAEVTLIAVPRPGYKFVYWLGDVLEPTANKTTTLLDEAKIIIAVFDTVDEDQIIVGQNAIGGGGGGGNSWGTGPAISGASGNRVRSSSNTTTQDTSGGGEDTGDTPGDGGDDDGDGGSETGDNTNDGGEDDNGGGTDNPIEGDDTTVDDIDDDDPGIDPPDDPVPPPVPEPATGLLLTLGAVGLLRKRRAGKTL